MTDLSGIMANLELQDQFVAQASGSSSNQVPQTNTAGSHRNLRRSSTNSINALYESSPPNKRRCSLKPTRNLNNTTIKSLESYYRNEKFKQPTKKSLETIFEEPLVKAGTVLLVGANKQRRIIFSGKVTKDKLKKRKTKIKKTCSGKSMSGTAIKKGRLSMEAFLTRLHAMMTNTNSTTNNNEDNLTSLLDANSSKLSANP